ncbi:hypothetical protein DVH05_011676 [Phytophthora capsici]|nr:hypothetical protein DVH05_011676 [Phytophthora capsici]
MTALMLAAQCGHANKQTRQGSFALMLAAKRGHNTAAVETLVTASADIFLKDGDTGLGKK